MNSKHNGVAVESFQNTTHPAYDVQVVNKLDEILAELIPPGGTIDNIDLDAGIALVRDLQECLKTLILSAASDTQIQDLIVDCS